MSVSQRKNVNKPSSINDYIALQQKFQQKVDDREIQEKVSKQLDVRAQKEAEYYRNIAISLEKMKLDVDIKNRERKEAFEKKVEASLKILEEEELAYQKQRADLMMNNRKILEQQEKELKENLGRLDDHFEKLENAFSKIIHTCSPGMSQIVEIYKIQLDEIKRDKNKVRSSLDGLKRSCINAEELCHALMAAKKDFDAQFQIRKAQKEAEEQQAQKEAEQAHAIAESDKQIQLDKTRQQTESIEERAKNHQSQAATSIDYKQLMQFLNEKQEATKQLQEDAALHNIRFALKLAVNDPINLLNEKNRLSLIEGFQKLQKLLAGERTETDKGPISITDHQQASDWTKLRLTEKLIVGL